MRKGMLSARVTVSLTQQDLKILRDLAERSGLSLASVVRMIVRGALATEMRKEAKQDANERARFIE